MIAADTGQSLQPQQPPQTMHQPLQVQQQPSQQPLPQIPQPPQPPQAQQPQPISPYNGTRQQINPIPAGEDSLYQNAMHNGPPPPAAYNANSFAPFKPGSQGKGVMGGIPTSNHVMGNGLVGNSQMGPYAAHGSQPVTSLSSNGLAQSPLPYPGGPTPLQAPPSMSMPIRSQSPINQAAQQSTDGGTARPVFGVSLDDLFARDGMAVPMVVNQCIQAVDLFGLEVEGIYRMSGTATHIAKLKATFEHGRLQH